jgi:hypothetical protein
LIGRKFEAHLLIEEKRLKDIADLKMLLQLTYVGIPWREIVHKDIVRICKEYKINIDIPGEK